MRSWRWRRVGEARSQDRGGKDLVLEMELEMTPEVEMKQELEVDTVSGLEMGSVGRAGKVGGHSCRSGNRYWWKGM